MKIFKLLVTSILLSNSLMAIADNTNSGWFVGGYGTYTGTSNSATITLDNPWLTPSHSTQSLTANSGSYGLGIIGGYRGAISKRFYWTTELHLTPQEFNGGNAESSDGVTINAISKQFYDTEFHLGYTYYSDPRGYKGDIFLATGVAVKPMQEKVSFASSAQGSFVNIDPTETKNQLDLGYVIGAGLNFFIGHHNMIRFQYNYIVYPGQNSADLNQSFYPPAIIGSLGNINISNTDNQFSLAYLYLF
tara:strand:- start:90920 stop:91660 length:741 start_codon:yes stop_codon:yes gene_type:complete